MGIFEQSHRRFATALSPLIPAGDGLDHWPSYAEMPPAGRAAYLAWLVGGRSDPDAPLEYVFLFFAGLEHFALVEAVKDPSLRAHLPSVATEVRRLVELYGAQRSPASRSSSFASYSGRFLDVLELLEFSAGDVAGRSAPDRDPERRQPPMALRLGLGRLARDGRPVPADWALSWQWYHPQIPRWAPQTRCREEFDELFHLRYRQRHGTGLVLGDLRSRISVDYHPASAGIGAVRVDVDLPDVLEQAGPTRKLSDLVDEVTGELDAYSRWLGQNPAGRGSLAAAALLPADLIDRAGGEVAVLGTWIDQQLSGTPRCVVRADRLLERWSTVRRGRMTKPEAVSVATLLGRLGVGIEPDVRLGGPAVSAGPVVLFRTAPGAPHTASPAYAAATSLLHLAVAVGAANGALDGDGRDHLVAHVESALQLTAAERIRLKAHLQWLVVTGVKLTGLVRRLATLSVSQRAEIGDFLVTVAAADGVVSPDEVKILARIYRLLGLPRDDAHGRIQHQLAGIRQRGTRLTPVPALLAAIVAAADDEQVVTVAAEDSRGAHRVSSAVRPPSPHRNP